jgi:toxin YhaV
MTERKVVVPIASGWSLYAHPTFIDQWEKLAAHVEALAQKDPDNFRQKKATKRLAAIKDLISEIIPADPARVEYRQGDTLGDDHKHWFRAKFFQQYRLFFRYSEQHKIIVFGWVNDDQTKRAYDSKTDAYRVFAKMLAAGQPPDDWDQLLSEARNAGARFAALADAASSSNA